MKARFVAGCDGARSAVRKSLGLALEGDSANQAWGVMDVLAVTDFPDFRMKSAIQSANEGSLLIIPREGGYLVRLYIELEKLNENERVASLNVTSDHLVAAARRILHPFTLEVKEVAWWSVYEIGQRLCDKFDDGREPAQDRSRACSCRRRLPYAQPQSRAGDERLDAGRLQSGMETGLGAARPVLAGDPEDLFGRTPGDRQGADRLRSQVCEDVQRAAEGSLERLERRRRSRGVPEIFVKQARFTAGTETRYAPSIISAKPTYQNLAQGLTIGMRFHSAPVIRLADARPVHLGHTVKADGRWRLFVFADAKTPPRGPRGSELSASFSPDPIDLLSDDTRRQGRISIS